jgi:hypothetical protein
MNAHSVEPREEGAHLNGEDRARLAEIAELERLLVARVYMNSEHAAEALELAPACDFVDEKAGQLLEAIGIVHARGEAVTLESVMDAVDTAYPNGGKKRQLDRLCEIADDYTYPLDPLWLAKRISEAHAQRESKRERAPILVRMADVEPEEVEFLWLPYLPKGKLTLLEGDPGLGKTWLALALAAAVSRGLPLPGLDGVPRGAQSPSNVIYMTAEDGLGDTLRPRLDAACADPERVLALDGMRAADGRSVPVTLADLDVLERAVAKERPALVVVDPIQAFLGAGTDMHRANEVRPVLMGFARLAERFGFAAVAIRHLRKSSADRSIQRGLGSIDFTAAARSILLVGEDPANEGRRVVAHHKSNLAKAGPSLAFEIAEGRFRWAGLSNLRADDLLASRDPAGVAPRREAESFLQDVLAAGPVAAREIERQAQELGIARSTLFRAKRDLGVVAARIGGFGDRGAWQWSLPEPVTTPKSATVPSREVGTLSSWGQNPAVVLECDAWSRPNWDSFEDHNARLEDEGLPREEAQAKAFALVVEERKARAPTQEQLA